MYRHSGNGRVAVVMNRVGPCTATMTSDTSDGGAPLHSPADPSKEAHSWSSIRLAAVQAREDPRSGAAKTPNTATASTEIIAARPAGTSAATLGQDREVIKPEIRADPEDSDSWNASSDHSLSQTVAVKDSYQVNISPIRRGRSG